jgi:hypothetical protein
MKQPDDEPNAPETNSEPGMSESTKVYLFRRDSLLKAGFLWDYACAIARSGADWHKAEKMLTQTDDQNMIAEILT